MTQLNFSNIQIPPQAFYFERMKVSMLFRSILFVAIPFKFSKATDDFDTKAHHAMLHSTRQLTS